jgi:hypothetical protein
MEKNKEIKFLLKGIELLDEQLKHPGKPFPAKSTFHFDINLEHRINPDNNLVIVICTISIKNNDKSTQLGLLKASCIFEVADLAAFIDKNKKQVDLPQETLTTFNSITISTVRGIMFSQFKGTFLHNAHLPIINPQSLTVNK